MVNTAERHSNWLNKRVNRRTVLRTSINGAAAALVIGAGVALVASQEFGSDSLTDEQKKALALFDTADETSFVHNIQVIGEEVNGQKKVYLRDKPRVATDKDDLSAGHRQGELKSGVVVDRALVVMGNSRDVSFDKTRQEKWLGIKMGDKVLFAISGLFQTTQELISSHPLDLSK